MMSEQYCDVCGNDLAGFGVVYFEGPDLVQRALCNACCNAMVAQQCGVNFQHVDFEPITLKDASGQPHTFRFDLRLIADRVALDAYEVNVPSPGGYTFQSISVDPDGDPLELFQQLFEKMRRALAQRHLHYDRRTGWQIGEGQTLRGRIDSDLDPDGLRHQPLVVIDGKPVTWEDLGTILMAHEGFCFKLEIYDKSEER